MIGLRVYRVWHNPDQLPNDTFRSNCWLTVLSRDLFPILSAFIELNTVSYFMYAKRATSSVRLAGLVLGCIPHPGESIQDRAIALLTKATTYGNAIYLYIIQRTVHGWRRFAPT